MLPRIGTISPKGGERSNAAAPTAVRRQTTVTRALRSRARLQHEPTRRRFVAKPRTLHLIPQAAQLFKIETANVRGQGARPLAFLWGFKRGYSLRKENTPFVWQQRKELHELMQRSALQPQSPTKGGDQKGNPLRKENTPFVWQWRKELHYPCSADGAATPIPPTKGENKKGIFPRMREYPF